MRHRKAGRKFSRRTNPRKNLFRNLAVSLILHERIKTTVAKAKEIQPIVERLVTLAREDTEHHRRLALAQLADDRAVAKLFEVLAPRFAGQPGGYTRIYKIGQRRGDGAPLALIEFVA